MVDKYTHDRHDANPEGRRKGALIPGSLASLETTLPPTPLKKLLAADGASVYVFSTDDNLVSAVQQAGGEQYPVHTVAMWEDLLEVVDRGLCHIVLLDADRLSERVESHIVELRGLRASLVILLAAPRDVAQVHVGLLSDRSIHRLLIKPAAVGITRLLLESAVSRFLQLREHSNDTLDEGSARPDRRQPSVARRWPAWLQAIALVSLLVGALWVSALVRLGSSESPAPPASGRGQDAAALPSDQATVTEAVAIEPVLAVEAADGDQPAPTDGPAAAIDEVPAEAVAETGPFAAELLRAAQAYQAGDIVRPIGASALDHYAAILAQTPEIAEAEEALTSILNGLYSEAEAAMLEGDLASASTSLAHVRRARPSSGRLAFLENQIARTREAQAAADVLEAGEPAPPTEFESLLGIAAARMERGLLIAPAGDSALDYLDRAAALVPDDARLLERRVDLAARATDRARLMLGAGDLSGATALIDAAFRFGTDTEAFAQLEIDLMAARAVAEDQERRRRLSLGQVRLSQGRLIEPAGDSALDHLGFVRASQPDFPEIAALWTELTEALADQARVAIDSGRWPDVEETISSLVSVGADLALVAELRQSLLVSRRQAVFLQVWSPASELVLIEYAPPSYPPAALRREIEGWVELEYVVDMDGRTRDARIVESSAEAIFDQAALDAIADYAYAPFNLEGQIYQRLVRLRVRFTLQ